jgi:putative ATPase
MRAEGYGKGYRYAHDFEGGIVGQENRPPNVATHRYYRPSDRGFERDLQRRLDAVEAVYRATLSAEESSGKLDHAIDRHR